MAAIYRGGAEHFRKMTMEKFIITGEAILNAMKEIADSAQFELDNAQSNKYNDDEYEQNIVIFKPKECGAEQSKKPPMLYESCFV